MADSSAESSTSTDASQALDLHNQKIVDCIDQYWRSNIRLMLVLLLIWAAAGLGAGILLADPLNKIHIGGFGLGFWFAQQGSIIIFVLLILVYCVLMNRLDAKHHKELTQLRQKTRSLRDA